MKHSTINISHGSVSADIDEEIAPLILAMWKCGLKTEFSCQDVGDNKVSIQFEGEQSFTKFLDMIATPNEDLGLPPIPLYPFPFLTWKFETYPIWREKTALMFNVIFPQEHIAYILWKIIPMSLE